MRYNITLQDNFKRRKLGGYNKLPPCDARMCLFDQTSKMKFHWTQLETATHFTNTTKTLNLQRSKGLPRNRERTKRGKR